MFELIGIIVVLFFCIVCWRFVLLVGMIALIAIAAALGVSIVVGVVMGVALS